LNALKDKPLLLPSVLNFKKEMQASGFFTADAIDCFLARVKDPWDEGAAHGGIRVAESTKPGRPTYRSVVGDGHQGA
jgi:hypothetical protein